MYEKTKDESEHYVNNRDFSNAIVDYVKLANEAEETGEGPPMLPDYIADCFLKIAQRMSFKANFINYTYREEMVMDAVENCLKCVRNYNIEAATRGGKPNAFGYFTQVCWYAFIRRINKEKRQQDIKMKYLSQADFELFVDNQLDQNEDPEMYNAANAYIETLRAKMDEHAERVEYDAKIKKDKESKDSDLGDFIS